MTEAKIHKNPLDRHPLIEQMSQLWRNKTAVAGMLIVLFFVFAAIFAPLLSPHDPVEISLYDQLKPPIWHEKGTWKNILGTDDLGRDILSRLIYGLLSWPFPTYCWPLWSWPFWDPVSRIA